MATVETPFGPVELQPLSEQELQQLITAAPQPTISGSIVPTLKLLPGQVTSDLRMMQELVTRQEHEEKLAEMGRAVEAWRNAAEARFARARECEDRMREQARVIAKQAAIILDLRKALMAPQPPPQPQAAQTERARQDAAVGRWASK